MLLCVILFWPSKIENSLSLMQNVFEVWELKENCFWKIWVEFKCFWKTFHFILMQFFIIKQCALRSFYIKMLCFSKNWFSKFSIDRTYCLTDRKCDKNLGYNLPGSIDAWLVLDWSKLIFDQSKFGLMVFLKAFSLICSSLYSTFQKAFCSLSSIDPP